MTWHCGGALSVSQASCSPFCLTHSRRVSLRPCHRLHMFTTPGSVDFASLCPLHSLVTKMVPSCSKLSSSDRLRYLNIPTLRYRRYRGDLIETCKSLHGIYDTTVSTCLSCCQFSATKGNNFKLVKHYCRYDIRKYGFTQRVVNSWNSLPSYVVNSISVNSFKTNTDKF